MTTPLPVDAREALEPFAEYADKNRRLPAEHIITQGSRFAKRQLTMGDCYRAADAIAALQSPSPQSEGEPGRIAELEREIERCRRSQHSFDDDKQRLLEAELSRLRTRAASNRSA